MAVQRSSRLLPGFSANSGRRDGAALRANRGNRSHTQAVVIEADGSLPEPSVGVVDGPPRIYLDFPGVRPVTRGTIPREDGPLRRVRAALYQASPPITRVVIDLTRAAPHRLETRADRKVP